MVVGHFVTVLPLVFSDDTLVCTSNSQLDEKKCEGSDAFFNQEETDSNFMLAY